MNSQDIIDKLFDLKVIEACNISVDLEFAFIDKVFEMGNLDNLTKARKTLREAQDNLTQAQKELRRSGQTQWDVNLLQQTIDEQKAIIKRAGSAERSAERRAATLDEAAYVQELIDLYNENQLNSFENNPKE